MAHIIKDYLFLDREDATCFAPCLALWRPDIAKESKMCYLPLAKQIVSVSLEVPKVHRVKHGAKHVVPFLSRDE